MFNKSIYIGCVIVGGIAGVGTHKVYKEVRSIILLKKLIKKLDSLIVDLAKQNDISYVKFEDYIIVEPNNNLN